jgi:hypothetical protein
MVRRLLSKLGMPPALVCEVCPPVRRSNIVLRFVNAGMALFLITGAVAFGAALVAPRFESGESKQHVAAITVRKYAYEAYPIWATAHPDRACPDRLADLDDYMGGADGIDPWGGRYQFACGPSVRGLWVRSAGEDGMYNTDDDVRSDR